jgi:hypothetical protein
MPLWVKSALTVTIVGAVIVGIVFVGLYIASKKPTLSSKSRMTPRSKSKPVEEYDPPLLVSGSPSLGPIQGPTQMPNCGVIWNNINVNYDLPVDNSLGPISPEYSTI